PVAVLICAVQRILPMLQLVSVISSVKASRCMLLEGIISLGEEQLRKRPFCPFPFLRTISLQGSASAKPLISNARAWAIALAMPRQLNLLEQILLETRDRDILQ